MNKIYLMNDVMEELNITRETLKYYEKIGLVEPQRTDKGYRMYDEIAVHKIKIIRDMKNVGFEYEEIKDFLNNFSTRKGKEVFNKRVEQVQREIEKMKILLNELNGYEKEGVDWDFYYENFHIIRGVVFCGKCCKAEVGKEYSHNVHNVQIYKITEDGEIEKDFYYRNVLLLVQNEYPNECKVCMGRTEFDKVWRGTIKYKNEEQFQERLREIYQNARKLDYELDDEIYCYKGYYKEFYGEMIEEGVAADIYIPFKC